MYRVHGVRNSFILPRVVFCRFELQVITYVLLSGSLPFYHCVLHKLCAKLRESFVDGNPASPEVERDKATIKGPVFVVVCGWKAS